MEVAEKIKKLEEFKALLSTWSKSRDSDARSEINRQKTWVRREVIEAGCFHSFTIGPPPAIGGLIMRDIDAFAAIFDPPYGMSMIPSIKDMIDQTIGVLEAGPQPAQQQANVQIEPDVQKGYAFIAMPIDPSDRKLDDVLDSIKEAARRCGIHAERVDEPQSNERITDRILESIRKAEYVIVDLTGSRPNVFYEAGYAHGLRKIPIYVAAKGTPLQFDLKDYPVIFFDSMRELKEGLEARLRGLAETRQKA
jgi:hypothetical protein